MAILSRNRLDKYARVVYDDIHSVSFSMSVSDI